MFWRSVRHIHIVQSLPHFLFLEGNSRTLSSEDLALCFPFLCNE
jgi:hypothetical protein